MSYKDLLIVLGDAASADRLSEFGHSFADAFGAHLTVAGLIVSSVAAVSFFGEFPAALVEKLESESEHEAAASYQKFSQAGVRPDGQSFLKISGETASAARKLAHVARRFDLTIIGQPDDDEKSFGETVIESVLFGSGRPLLIAPFIHKGPVKLKKIIAAWDGGVAATRALAAAMPLLVRAESVEVVTVVEKGGEPDSLPGVDITRHLARHGVAAELKALPAGNIDVGSVLLSYAADQSADVLVMGGYGHSRLREFFLGGATRSIMQSMTLPILMAH